MTAKSGRHHAGQTWCIVLAGGDGSRLRPMVTESLGVDCPKQYCSFNGGGSLLHKAISRALMVTTRDRVVPVVASDHRLWWVPELSRLPAENIVVQPCNRGTACGLLLPLAQILLQDPHAIVVALPSDHLVDDEATLAGAVRRAVAAVKTDADAIVLLGIEADAADPDLGWIAPSFTHDKGLHAVLSFVEKPSPQVAAQLMNSGGLLNSFVFVARGLTLLAVCEKASPGIVERFGAAVVSAESGRTERIGSLYDHLPTLDLSRDVLQNSVAELRVIPVPPCGWTDLGTPERVARKAAAKRFRITTPPDGDLPAGSRPDLAHAAASYLVRQQLESGP